MKFTQFKRLKLTLTNPIGRILNPTGFAPRKSISRGSTRGSVRMSNGNVSSGIGSGAAADLNLTAVDEMDADESYDSDDSQISETQGILFSFFLFFFFFSF